MAVRKIVKIDEELCDGCGECVPSCHEGAIQIIDGKARLVGENLCDGLGDCLGNCPVDAITIEEREADEFDEDAVAKHLTAIDESQDRGRAKPTPAAEPMFQGCPGSRTLNFTEEKAPTAGDHAPAPSTLQQWPVQLHLVPPTAPYFNDADLLLAADCTAYSLGDFHGTHLKNKALAIACPKLDQGMDVYLDKLIAMIDQGNIKSLTVMIMEVPCCGGLAQLAQQALAQASRKVPATLIVAGIRGDILDSRSL
ncbi:MAG: 4Fe-4S ferredoxin [bacterium]|nr:4Fe-4S ferredoxin [bacterium]